MQQQHAGPCTKWVCFSTKIPFFNLTLSRRNFPSTVMGGVGPRRMERCPSLNLGAEGLSIPFLGDRNGGPSLFIIGPPHFHKRASQRGERRGEEKWGIHSSSSTHDAPPPRSRPHLVPIRNRRIRRRGRVSHSHISARPRDRIQISKPPPKKFGQWCGPPPGEGGREAKSEGEEEESYKS